MRILGERDFSAGRLGKKIPPAKLTGGIWKVGREP
jgi:hypothetical protein